LDFTLKGMCFEAAIYRRDNGGNALPVGVYVDDLVITGTKMRRCQRSRKR
jgi:hypothetical protein